MMPIVEVRHLPRARVVRVPDWRRINNKQFEHLAAVEVDILAPELDQAHAATSRKRTSHGIPDVVRGVGGTIFFES
jgi:hypothetical protein